MQHDPLGINPAGGKENPFSAIEQYTDGLNLFQYARSNPVIFTDPSGQICVIPFWLKFLIKTWSDFCGPGPPLPPTQMLPCMCEWATTSVGETTKSVCCDEEIENTFCPDVLDTTSMFVCKVLPPTESVVYFGNCARVLTTRHWIEKKMAIYICTANNKWLKTGELKADKIKVLQCDRWQRYKCHYGLPSSL